MTYPVHLHVHVLATCSAPKPQPSQPTSSSGSSSPSSRSVRCCDWRDAPRPAVPPCPAIMARRSTSSSGRSGIGAAGRPPRHQSSLLLVLQVITTAMRRTIRSSSKCKGCPASASGTPSTSAGMSSTPPSGKNSGLLGTGRRRPRRSGVEVSPFRRWTGHFRSAVLLRLICKPAKAPGAE